LHLHEEQLYPIQGLEFPEWETSEGAADFTAAKLFLQSAQHVRPNYRLAQNDLTYLTRICRLVEGMPLGLELAAAWVDMLSLADIAAEIQQSLDFLETEMRNMPARQRSMRATFDYSWQKLDKKDQSIFVQLSIFRGGFTRPAAQAVTETTLQELSQLVNKSFMQYNRKRDRYQVHELLRQYGADKLGRDSELERTAWDGHSTYYCQTVGQYTNDLKGARQQQALTTIKADIENVRLAWNHAVTRLDLSSIGACLEALYRFYWRSTYLQAGINDFEKAVAILRTGEAIGARGILLGRLLAILGWFYSYWYSGISVKAIAAANESLELLQGQGAREETVMTLLCLAMNQESLEESNRLLSESLVLAREFNDQWASGDALLKLGQNARAAGDYEKAEQQLLEALQQFRQTGDKGGIVWALNSLSVLAGDRGRYDEALTLARKTMTLVPEFNSPEPGFYSLGRALYDLGAYEEAEAQFHQGLTFLKELGLRHLSWLFELGNVAFRTGDYAHAHQLHQESLAGALEFDDLELVVKNHNALGRLHRVQGSGFQAGEHFQSALQVAILLGRSPILLACMVNIAELLVEEGDLEYAALLATLITNHPASQAKIKERADQLLTRLEAELSANDLADLRQRSRPSDLDTVAAQLLVDLKTQ
jgi:predicted ATPase